MTTYLIEATAQGYRMAVTNMTIIPQALQSGDVILTENGGHGPVEEAYGQVERSYHDARQIARSDPDTQERKP
jgi:hypothetical protein